MPILTDDDKTKKLSDYLGITGTDAEIQKKMEDSEAARDVINQIFEYRADDLFHNRKPYPFVVEKLAGMTLGEIERDKDTLLRGLKGFYDEMFSDYTEGYGDTKRKPFLEATGYDSALDGDEKGYFFKFWRSPLTKLLDYRKLDIFDTADKEKINEILGKLFGPETTKYNSLDLISKTPETLVEDKDVLAREAEARKRTEETEKELLKTKPLIETFEKLDNIHFTPYVSPIDEDHREPFLRATGYNPDSDGDEKDYFNKFWNAPMSDLLAHRKIDPKTKEGKEKIAQIWKELVGPMASEMDYFNPSFLNDTFKSDFIGVDRQIRAAHEAFLQPDAHKRLKKLMGTKEELDEETFIYGIFSTPQQIQQDADNIAKGLAKGENWWVVTTRNDKRFIAANPGKTFADLLHRDGRPEIPFGEDAKNMFIGLTLRNVLGKGPLDHKAVKNAMDRPLSELVANADKIVADVKKRGKRNQMILYASVIVGTLAATLGIGKMFSGNESSVAAQPEPTPAPIVQKAAPEQSQAQPSKGDKDGMSGRLATVTNQTVAATQADKPQTTTDTQVKKVDMPVKGNRLVSMTWAGFKDIVCRTIEPDAARQLFSGEFDNMFYEIRTKGLPYGDIYDHDFVSKALSGINNVVNVGGAPGHAPFKFYIKRDSGRSAQAIVQDMLNWHDNMNDVLSSLPVSKENLVQAQLRTMDAIGPSLGWSMKQQAGWQMANPDVAQDAREKISALTAAGMKERKVDPKNVEAVFMEAINAASIYRQQNPGAQTLFPIVEEITRKTAGIELENMAQYDKVQKTQPVQISHDGSAPSAARPAPLPQYPQQRYPQEKEGYSLWWVAGAFAAGMYMMWVRAKRKNQVIK